MEEYKCPFAEKNKQAHGEFMEQIKAIRKLSEKHELTHSKILDLYYEMVYWIKAHILEIDVNNFNCVKDKLVSKKSTSSTKEGAVDPPTKNDQDANPL